MDCPIDRTEAVLDGAKLSLKRAALRRAFGLQRHTARGRLRQP
jgi:hypothetical protein